MNQIETIKEKNAVAGKWHAMPINHTPVRNIQPTDRMNFQM